MAYYDYNTVNKLIYDKLYKIPQNIELIVCIPRSGMIIGTIIGEYRNLPVCTISEYLNNISTEKCAVHSKAKQFISEYDYKNILLVDDTCSSGETLLKIKQKIIDVKPNINIITYCVFAEKIGKDLVDIYLLENNWPVFPYSILKCTHEFACFDIDGILTEEVPAEIDDDGDKYLSFISTQRSLYIPQDEILCLVTGRLEKYRESTEKWLNMHNVHYKYLFMCPAKNKEERKQLNPAIFKANIYKDFKAEIFIESSLYEAKIIKEMTNKPVYCTEIMNLV